MDKDKKISQLAASGGIGGSVILDGEELIPFSKRGTDGVWTNGAMTASRLAALARKTWLVQLAGDAESKTGATGNLTGWSQAVAALSLNMKPVSLDGLDRNILPGDLMMADTGFMAIVAAVDRFNDLAVFMGVQEGIPLYGHLAFKGADSYIDVSYMSEETREWVAGYTYSRDEVDRTLAEMRRQLNILEARIGQLEGPGSGMEGGMI